MDNTERIRKTDAFVNALTTLADELREEEARGILDPEAIQDVRRYVLPLLQAEAEKAAKGG